MFVKVTLVRPKNPQRTPRDVEDMDAAVLYINARSVFGVFPHDAASFPPLAKAALLLPIGQVFIAEASDDVIDWLEKAMPVA